MEKRFQQNRVRTYWEPEGYYQLGQGIYKNVTMAAVVERLKTAAGVMDITELANWLGIRRSWIADTIRRNIVPIAWLNIVAEKRPDCDPAWILTGSGSKVAHSA